MTCNCNQYYAFPPQQCASGYKGPVGPVPCTPHFPVVRANFVVPAKDSEVVIEVTDSSRLYVGQGLQIGVDYYIITDIVDSINIKVKHNGLATPNQSLVANHPTHGCSQYPITPPGIVLLDKVVTIVGLDEPGSGGIAGAIVSVGINKMVYGQVGPSAVQFFAEGLVEVDNAPHWLGMNLPWPRRTDSPQVAFTAWLDDGSGPVPAIGKFGEGAYSDYVIIGPGGGNQFTNGTDRRVVVSGMYEILL